MCSLTTLMCTGGPAAFAHTTVQDAATAGTGSFNAFVIPHGCGAEIDGVALAPLKVRGQSAVFPFGVAVWTDLSTGEVIETGAVGIITKEGEDDFITLDVTGIQDDDPFTIQQEETNPLGNDPPGPFGSVPVRALNWKGGPGLKTDLAGTPKFRVTPPTILDACVSALHVRIAVANWCKFGKNEANDPLNNRADWWFTGSDQTGSTLFVDPDLVQEDSGDWTTLTVNNPDAASCTGTPREVAVQPSGADIDTYLPYKPFTKNPGQSGGH